jgi:hypothetical protein
VAALVVVRPPSPAAPPREPLAPSVTSTRAENEAAVDPGDAWEFVVTVAEGVDTTQEPLPPGSADRAVDTLSVAERRALAVLLESELHRSGES